jgi:uncharacterized protein YidB (DUF937 family)
MANPLLGQILGSVFSNAMRGRSSGGVLGGGGAGGMGGMSGMGSSGGGGLGDLLGGMMGRGGGMMGGGSPAGSAGRDDLGGSGATGGLGGLGGNRGMLVALLLPLAMQWVQRNGGIGAVLDRFKQKGYQQQADSWVSTGPNQMLDSRAVDDVVGSEELSRLSQQLGIPQQEVADGFAEILPEMADQLSPQGQVTAEADEALNGGLSELEQLVQGFRNNT